jgi:hypothetical protein
LFSFFFLSLLGFFSFSYASYYCRDSTTTIKLECEVSVKGDEVFFGTPYLSVNELPILCHCGKRALKVTTKAGKVVAFCSAHTPEREKIQVVEEEYKEMYSKK